MVPLERGDSPLTDNTQNYSNACQVSEKQACLSRFPFYQDTLYIKHHGT